ncbi:MAG: hypothetical protein ACXWLM_11105 [Myxococcales bacterium]
MGLAALLAAQTVLVLPFAVQGTSGPWAGVAVAEALTDHLAQVNRDNFVSLRQLAAVLRRRELEVASAQVASIAREVARPLGATEMVIGAVKGEGDRCAI